MLRSIRDYLVIKRSGLFDENHYLLQNPDVRVADVDPLMHFVKFGWTESRDPSSKFNTGFYLTNYEDVRAARINPLVHYLKFGCAEGRLPSPSVTESEEGLQKKTLFDSNTNGIKNDSYKVDGSSTSRSKLYLPFVVNITKYRRFISKFGFAEFVKKVRTKLKNVNQPNEPNIERQLKVGNNSYEKNWSDSFDIAKNIKTDEFVEFIPNQEIVNDAAIQLIAFYLPQFHPFPENDLWWGKGFTEWANVSKATPQFVGHYQPRLPSDLGFYDLRVPEIQEQQATLASQYGISAFCFHYYWFNGKRLMEKPLESYIANPKIKLPFCICWANENWTRRWDGSSGELLISQEHNLENNKRFIHDMINLFRHPRYFRVDGRPLLIVYNPDLLEEPQETLKYWRAYSEEHGVENPFILAAQTFYFLDPRAGGFDGAVSFPPHHMVTMPDISDQLEMLNPDHRGSVFSYSDMVEGFTEKLKDYPYEFYPTILPDWDNEARRPGSGTTFHGSSPIIYGDWLMKACQYQIRSKAKSKRMVFVNAWNEWAEGAYLEPDRRFGYAYLQKTLDTLHEVNGIDVTNRKKIGSQIDESISRHIKVVSQRWPIVEKDNKLTETEALQIAKGLDGILKNTTQNSPGKPKISVIIPVYNHLETTINCLKSIGLSGDKTNLELIVVDDGSTDETKRVLGLVKSILLIQNERNLGFLNSCNNAAKNASGEIFCFLNNDTIVLPGWSDSIVKTFEDHPKAGLVGSKLYYPDGSLQEAGGLIWNDGGGTNFGRNDNPNRPEYCYLRNVDYCSGAAIFVWSKVWQEMKGFDPIFSPAYYEDTDLAFRVRQAGYQVLFQPFSKVIHIEGATSGTDLSKGIKHYQAINKETFYHRWREILTTHSSPCVPDWTNINHSNRPRALVLDVCTPKPDVDSGSIDTYNYIVALEKLGFEVTFISTDDADVVDRYVYDLQFKGVHCMYPPYLKGIERFLKDYGKLYSLAILFRAPFGGRYMKLVKKHMPEAKVIFNTVDLHFLREKRERQLQLEDGNFTEGSIISEEYEVGLMKAADISILVSEYERSFLSELYPKLNTSVMPIPREIPGRKKKFAERKDIAFVGGFLHKPNVDAIHFFVKEIWPLILGKFPGMRFKIVGSNLPKEFKVYESDHIELVGFVKDLGVVFDNVRLSVSPLRYGAGIKGKVVSSLSYGLPCVATSMSIEGMGLTENLNVLVSDKPESFAELVVTAYQNEDLWEKISNEGLKFVETRHSVESFEKNLIDLLNHLGMERE